jgi:hypothetical protein
MTKIAVEIISLSTPRGRLLFFIILTFFIFLTPYKYLSGLSLWQRIGWDWAPSIGLTRAYHMLIHGNFMGAWHRNPLIYLIITIGLMILAKDVYKLLSGKNQKNAIITDTIS